MMDPSKSVQNDLTDRQVSKKDASDRRLLKLSLAALGVVFGDIGTSPLYAIRECFHGEYGIAVSPANVLGVLSLMFWSLVMIVTLKYLIFVLRADNQGEGGVMALTALIKSERGQVKNSRLTLVSIGLFAACLLYGDGMITPAISVLSAVEGIRIITPLFKPYVLPATIIILGGLFMIQRRGTAKIGGLFGPVILVWFSVLALLGFIQIVRSPQVLAAILPWYGTKFILINKFHGFVVLGAVFLVVTGAEALYADMGHFGRRPIQLTWIVLVLPALVLNYIGQIYVTPVNWLLMICTIGLVLGFQSSSKLAAAYGVAVTSTMLVTTTLFYVVARKRWGWSQLAAGTLAGIFFLVDIPFFGANISKIFHGAWFPLAIGAFFFMLMLTWEQGRKILADQFQTLTTSFGAFKKSLDINPPQRVNSQAVFLTGNPDVVPSTLVQNLKHNKIIHSDVAILHFKTENVPRVPNFDKVKTEKLGGGFFQIIAHHGFMEEPKIDMILALAHEQGLNFKLEEASYYLGREKLSIGPDPVMGRWRSHIFIFISRNSMDAASFFGIPPDQIIEVGVQMQTENGLFINRV